MYQYCLQYRHSAQKLCACMYVLYTIDGTLYSIHCRLGPKRATGSGIVFIRENGESRGCWPPKLGKNRSVNITWSNGANGSCLCNDKKHAQDARATLFVARRVIWDLRTIPCGEPRAVLEWSGRGRSAACMCDKSINQPIISFLFCFLAQLWQIFFSGVHLW